MNPHFGPPLTFLGAALGDSPVAVILVHGRAQSPAYMEEHVFRRLDLPALAYVAPAAEGNTWYPESFLAPIEENEPRLRFARDRLAALSDDLLTKGYPCERQALVGFSQGACVLSEYVYRRGLRYGALVAFTGGLVGPPGTRWTAKTEAFRGMPVLLGGSDVDPYVPASRMLETAEVFRRLGARVKDTLYPGMGHEICDEQIAEARAILGGLLKTSVH